MVKQDYINQLSLLDVSTLANLYKYSQLLIIPDQDLLLNVNMAQMVDKAHSLADAYFPDWTDRSKSDFGEFLVELTCLFSEKDFWYVNAFASEAELSKMTLYGDAFVRAVNMGYRPVLCAAAGAYFNVTFQPGSADYTYAVNELVLSQPSTGLEWTNSVPFTVPAALGATVLPLQLFEGKYITQTYNFDGHSINIPKKLVGIGSIILTINSVVWTRVDIFGQSGPNDTHYVVLPGPDGSAVIFFGEDGYGFKPNIGDIATIKFKQCTGSAGNLDITTISVNRSAVGRPATTALQTTPSVKGTMPETLAQMQNNAPTYKGTKGHCYNEYSTIQFLNALDYVKQSDVEILGNKVYFYIIPKSGDVADTPLLTETGDTIDEFLMSGYNPIPQPTTYITVTPLNITCSFLKGYDPTNGLSLVRQLVEDYTNPLVLAKYGADFDLTALSLLLRSNIPGLQNVIYNVVAGITPANVVVPDHNILQKLDQTQFTCNATVV